MCTGNHAINCLPFAGVYVKNFLGWCIREQLFHNLPSQHVQFKGVKNLVGFMQHLKFLWLYSKKVIKIPKLQM